MRTKRSIDFRMAPKKSTEKGKEKEVASSAPSLDDGWLASSAPNLIFYPMLMNIFCNPKKPSSGVPLLGIVILLKK